MRGWVGCCRCSSG